MARTASRRPLAQRLTLVEAAEFLLEECRMVLPGIQALFGFQLIAVFNSSFTQRLTPAEQRLHLLAIALVVLSAAIIMTPAATHRQTGAQALTQAFIIASTRLLLWGMAPLAIGICLDFYLIARLILGGGGIVVVLTGAMLATFVILWFLFPRIRALRHTLAEEG